MIAKLDDLPRKRWTMAEYHKLADLGFFYGQKIELLEGEIWIQWPDAKRTGLPYPSDEPYPRLWTKEEYYRLGELGFFTGQKVELWEGEIVVMSPQGPLHYASVDRVRKLLERLLDLSFAVRMQGPLDVGQHTEPEPDIAVVPAQPDLYATGHPHVAFLIVEVSDSSVSIDRNRKGSLYSRAAIPDYWIVNLVDDQLELYRNPQPDPSQPYGHRYATPLILRRPDAVSPLAAPSVHIPVADLLG
jgi:Uma2 family endonuclease